MEKEKAKKQAKILRGYLSEKGVDINHSTALEASSRMRGFKSWNVEAGLDTRKSEELQAALRILEERLRSEMGDSLVNFKVGEGSRRGKSFITLDIGGRYEDHPYDVDEHVRKAIEGTDFLELFYLMGTGTAISQNIRDLTYYSGKASEPEKWGEHPCPQCDHFHTQKISEWNRWCSACGISIGEGIICVPNPKMKGYTLEDLHREDAELLGDDAVIYNE